METKTCTGCNEAKGISEFSPKGDSGQRHSQCRTCRAAAARASRSPRITVGNEPRTYFPGGEHSFFSDVYNARKGAPNAQARLDQHAKEQRAVSTSTGGFAPPEYLGDEYALVARTGRPFANVVPTIPLVQSGVQFSIPKMTTGDAVDVQAAENDSVTEQDIVSTTVTANVVEITGQLDMSRQVFERIYPGVDTVIYADLMDAFGDKLDSQLLNGSGSNGQHLGVRNVSGANTQTYTQASPDQQTFVLNVLQAASAVATNRKKWPTHIVLHPRRYAWLLSASGTAALIEHEEDGLAGMKFVLDSNVGTAYGASTSQDEAYVVYAPDFLLAESQAFFKFEDVLSNTLTCRAQLHSNSLFFANRQAKSIAVVSGTGMAAPSGF